MFTSRAEANAFYNKILLKAEGRGPEQVRLVAADLGKRDLFFLLTRVLHRADIDQGIHHRRGHQAHQPRIAAHLPAHEHRRAQPRPVLGFQRAHDPRRHVQLGGDVVDAHPRRLAGLLQAFAAARQGVMGRIGMLEGHCARGAVGGPGEIACSWRR